MNILSLFPAVPLVMMLGLWLSKSTRQIHTVMVAGSSLLVALAVVLVVQYLGLRGAGETAQMLNMLLRVRKPCFRKAAWKGGNSFGKR